MGEQFRRPWVVAHRGASAKMAEHTLGAYQRAIELGADALECDVRLTADGHLVCVHDPRIDRTSDGTGRVSTKTLPQLMDHDFASWWDAEKARESGVDPEELPDFDEDINGILTLDRLLDLITSSARPVGLLIETKHPTRFGGYVEQAVVQALERYGLVPAPGEPARIRVMSFSSIAMRRMREMAPTIPCVYLMDKVSMIWRAGQLPSGATIAGPGLAVARKYEHVVRRWQANGFGLFIWTVDTGAALDEALDLGVDAVITNRPGAVRDWLDELG